MAQTPEGKVKAKVSKLLLRYGSKVYYHMPVPGGYGSTTLDYIGCAGGKFFVVETKAPGKKPTDRQNMIIEAVRAAGGTVFVIDGGPGQLEALDAWVMAACTGGQL